MAEAKAFWQFAYTSQGVTWDATKLCPAGQFSGAFSVSFATLKDSKPHAKKSPKSCLAGGKNPKPSRAQVPPLSRSRNRLQLRVGEVGSFRTQAFLIRAHASAFAFVPREAAGKLLPVEVSMWPQVVRSSSCFWGQASGGTPLLVRRISGCPKSPDQARGSAPSKIGVGVSLKRVCEAVPGLEMAQAMLTCCRVQRGGGRSRWRRDAFQPLRRAIVLG